MGDWGRTARDLLAWFAFLIAAVALAARFVPVINHAVLAVAALSPYLTICGAAVSALLLLPGHRRLAGIALLLIVAAVSLQAPRFVGADRPEGQRTSVRVLTANVREGHADPNALGALALSQADLLVIQELTPEFADGLHQLDSDFPYRVARALPSANGVGIWSRYPVTESTRIAGYELGMLQATVRVPGAATDAVVLAAHLVGPWPQPIDGWRNEIAALPNTLRSVARSAGDAAVIVAGDLNATADMLPFRRLIDGDYRNAAELAGAGLTPTFPADRSVPPLLDIDHILIRNCAASDVRTVRIPGSDHLGLIGTVGLR